MTTYLAFEHILAINKAVTGDECVRDAGGVESACARPRTSVFGEDAYSTIWEKAAALMQSLACNHGFLDGNKRTAWTATMSFLEVNGHSLDPAFSVDAAESLVLAVATGSLAGIQDIASALVKFCL